MSRPSAILRALIFSALSCSAAWAADYSVLHDPSHRLITLADSRSNLVFRLNLDHRCLLDQVLVRGRQVVSPANGVCSGICLSNQWFTTRSNIPVPKVELSRNTITVSDILFGGAGMQVNETWKFTALPDRILWQINRKYPKAGYLDDTLFPGWDFVDMKTWTGGLLDHGGVAWNKYLETPNATYATHASAVTFWNPDHNDCLRIATTSVPEPQFRSQGSTPGFRPSSFDVRCSLFDHRRPMSDVPCSMFGVQCAMPGVHHPPHPASTLDLPSSTLASPFVSLRFTRQPSGIHTVAFSVTGTELQPRHNLCRFLPSRQDLWAPFQVSSGELTVTYTLQALDYDQACNRGVMPGLNERSIRELLNTIGRYGVIDRRIVGANGWRTGFKCLHEQWFSQMGIAIDDPAYLANCAATFDFERDHAILPDGRVKARWWYVAGDAMPGTYDPLGYYEAQWGMLLDSQPAFVICVAELFDLTGDRAWLRGQKTACESALDHLLRRDSNGNGLVEMMTDSHTQQKGSDWIDIIWAAHENALVNAELYYALLLWADAEELLDDTTRAATYRQCAAILKAAFNKTTADGGFWDAQNQWYVYWRDKDGSIHGNNLVTPVNFAAISYGLCDDPARRDAILRRIEIEMQKENLFFWPLSFFPYNLDEGHPNNFPFPKYENGDIFLSWGELAVRACARSDPALALKYIRNVLQKYDADGLSFQRYERKSQHGAGEDILAGNCMTIVGLYRDIYGIQPKHNRLYLEPHLTADLNGTQLRYNLRSQSYLIDLNTTGTRVAVDGFALFCGEPFGLNVNGGMLEFFPGDQTTPALSVTVSGHGPPLPLEVRIESWPTNSAEPRRWVESSKRDTTARHVITGLQPAAQYRLIRDGKPSGLFRADDAGAVVFKTTLRRSSPTRFELLPP